MLAQDCINIIIDRANEVQILSVYLISNMEIVILPFNSRLCLSFERVHFVLFYFYEFVLILITIVKHSPESISPFIFNVQRIFLFTTSMISRRR